MSNILVQNIKHTNNTTSMSIDTSGQVTIRGEGSATTTNLQQGLVKVWCKFQGDAGNIFTDANFDNFNISGLTDNGTGDYTVNIDNAMTNAKYSCCTHNASNHHFSGIRSTADMSATAVRIFVSNGSSNADKEECGVKICGDLA